MARGLETIRSQIRALEKQALAMERGASKGVRAAVRLIAKHGLTLADLKLALKGGGVRRGPLAGTRAPVKYRDDAGNKWTGRGRAPLWLVAAEKSGKKRESFLITEHRASSAKNRPKSKRKNRSKKTAAAQDENTSG